MRANIPCSGKHGGSKSLFLTNSLSAGMLRPYKIEISRNPKALRWRSLSEGLMLLSSQ